MDGPNVNLKFYTDLTKERNSEELPQLLNIGSCGLHIVHGGLQKGVNESGWKLGHLMRSLWQLFHDTPARCEDFVKLTGSTVFPLKFCPHRLVEDVVVAGLTKCGPTSRSMFHLSVQHPRRPRRQPHMPQSKKHVRTH